MFGHVSFLWANEQLLDILRVSTCARGTQLSQAEHSPYDILCAMAFLCMPSTSAVVPQGWARITLNCRMRYAIRLAAEDELSGLTMPSKQLRSRRSLKLHKSLGS